MNDQIAILTECGLGAIRNFDLIAGQIDDVNHTIGLIKKDVDTTHREMINLIASQTAIIERLQSDVALLTAQKKGMSAHAKPFLPTKPLHPPPYVE
jgi:uncharacterized protein YoxC